MSFLLDTNICSAYVKDDRELFSRFVQHAGNLFTSRLTVAELYAWVHLSANPSNRQRRIDEFLKSLEILEFDDTCAREYGRLRGELRSTGANCPAVDLMIGSTALVHGLTVVTHNLRDFQRIPRLTLVDWLAT